MDEAIRILDRQLEFHRAKLKNLRHVRDINGASHANAMDIHIAETERLADQIEAGLKVLERERATVAA